MRFGSNRGQLYDAQKTARAKWDDVCETWDDAPRREFDETAWQPLDRAVSDYLRAVDQLTAVFAGVRADCEFGS